MKSVRVKIGGQEYSLRTDDEGKLCDIAERVDSQLKMLQSSTSEQSTSTLSILTALTIAEQEYDSRKQQTTDVQYLVAEIETMINFLRQSFAKSVV
jgi:cell division protein ZapA (FtsZ GTPase activity inhibitor)